MAHDRTAYLVAHAYTDPNGKMLPQIHAVRIYSESATSLSICPCDTAALNVYEARGVDYQSASDMLCFVVQTMQSFAWCRPLMSAEHMEPIDYLRSAGAAAHDRSDQRGATGRAGVAQAGLRRVEGSNMNIKGFHTHRFADNPEEQRFAEAWERMNGHPSAVNYMLHVGDQNGHVPAATDRERAIVASVIQWLGSPVGQGFLRDLGYERKT